MCTYGSREIPEPTHIEGSINPMERCDRLHLLGGKDQAAGGFSGLVGEV